jgi:hypothetical protein
MRAGENGANRGEPLDSHGGISASHFNSSFRQMGQDTNSDSLDELLQEFKEQYRVIEAKLDLGKASRGQTWFSVFSQLELGFPVVYWPRRLSDAA